MMAVTSTDDQVPTPGDDTCAFKQEDSEEPCPGHKADGFDHCLAHLEPAQLDQVLQRLGPGADLDASGTAIDAVLLARILGALRDEAGHPVFGRVSFAEARFSDGPDFGGAQFSHDAYFGGAQFSGYAQFAGAQFSNEAYFWGAKFSDDADFGGAQFSDDAYFDGAQFSHYARFGGAQFSGYAQFAGAQFSEYGHFGGAQFSGSHFGGANFGGAHFAVEASFAGARFRQTPWLGPLIAGHLDLTEAVFDSPIVIEAAAGRVSCPRTTWKAGVTFRLRYAALDLERATLTQPSSFTTSDLPFYAGTSRLDESRVVELILNERADAHEAQSGAFPAWMPSDIFPAWMPSLETMGGVDAANLSVTDVNLSRCRFAGALLLDQLRLEGFCVFDQPPRGIRAGRAWLPVWRWSRRQSLAEERLWRASTAKRSGWSNPEGGEYPQAGPDRLAALYRQLRKAQEDAKNEPGAADFYYGEMEMRRHAPSTPWAERLILAAYWAVSGYGLRATRAFIALAILIAGSALVLRYAGFPGHTPAYLDSLFYAAGSVLSLSLVIGHLPVVLTHWGDVIRMLLRIAGPVLLGLAALALRGRVKR